MVKADIVDEVQNKTGFPRQKVQDRSTSCSNA